MSDARYPKVVGYTLVHEIGKGGFSSVYQAVHMEEHRVAAVKVVYLSERTTQAERKALDREMRIHGALNDEHIIHFMDAVVVEKPGSYTPAVYILLELAAGGDLFDKIVPDVGIDSETAKLYFQQLVDGTKHIHQQGVVHRDLKPENILLDAAGTLKISDFGLAAVWQIKDTGKQRSLTDVCGSLPYIAPELALGQPYHAPPIDVWGLGVILFTLLVGNTPWDEPTQRSPEFAAYTRNDFQHDHPWNLIPGPELSLILALLTVNPAKRMTIEQIYGHPFMMTQSQLVGKGAVMLAERLTKNLREAGDLDLAAPPQLNDLDGDGDIHMSTAPPSMSQFTQSLMLFSQTQSGPRYTAQLTRFYTALPADRTFTQIVSACPDLNLKFKFAKDAEGNPSPKGEGDKYILKVAGVDARQEGFIGRFEIEEVARGGKNYSLVIMHKQVGSPISWRTLWKAVIQHGALRPHVLRRQ